MNKAISTRISLGKRSIANLSDRFLSVAIDTSHILGKDWWAPSAKVDWALIGSHEGSYDLEPYDFTRKKLRTLGRYLAPAYLKIGGAKSDKLFYALKASANQHEFVLTKDKWDEINEFTGACGFDIIFTLNAGRMNRDRKKNWIPERVREFVEYTAQNRYPVSVWKLGGEINAFITNGSKWRISGKQYAKDFLAARRLIDGVMPGTKLIGCSSAYWPIIGEPFPVSKSFLKNNKAQLDVFGWHYYPQQSLRCPVRIRRAGPYTMLKPENLNEVRKWARRVERLRQAYSPDSEIWLTETGHAQCGGMPGVSDAFIASLWWLDQLGTLAQRGHSVIVRQTLSGSDYGLINDVTLEPNPDYWASVLWKRLMGTDVFEVDAQGGGPHLRLYAHRHPKNDDIRTLLALNIHKKESYRISFCDAPKTPVGLYLITSDELFGKKIKLNNTELTMDGDSLPELKPESVQKPIVLPPCSYAFMTISI